MQDEASKVDSQLRSRANERVASLARMAARWESAGGTEYESWRSDAANHVSELPGLRTLEWIDATYHVRWIEPLAGNERRLGRDMLSANPTRRRAARRRRDRARDADAATPPDTGLQRIHRLSTTPAERAIRRLRRGRILHRGVLPRRDRARAVAQLRHVDPA